MWILCLKYLWMLSAAVVIVALRIKTHLDTWNYLEAKSHFIDELHKIDKLHFFGRWNESMWPDREWNPGTLGLESDALHFLVSLFIVRIIIITDSPKDIINQSD